MKDRIYLPGMSCAPPDFEPEKREKVLVISSELFNATVLTFCSVITT